MAAADVGAGGGPDRLAALGFGDGDDVDESSDKSIHMATQPLRSSTTRLDLEPSPMVLTAAVKRISTLFYYVFRFTIKRSLKYGVILLILKGSKYIIAHFATRLFFLAM